LASVLATLATLAVFGKMLQGGGASLISILTVGSLLLGSVLYLRGIHIWWGATGASWRRTGWILLIASAATPNSLSLLVVPIALILSVTLGPQLPTTHMHRNGSRTHPPSA
jgi:hypothetical protein